MKNVVKFLITLLLPISVYATEPKFSSVEKDYIKNNPKISVAVLSTNQSPYIGKNKFGDFFGIHIDYINSISNIIGIDVKYNTFETIKELLASVESGDSDIALGFSKTPERSKRYIFSEPFFEGNIAIWYRKAKARYLPIKDLSWTCVEGTIYCDRLVEQGITNIKKARFFSEAIGWVNEGDSDAIIANYVTIAKYLNDNNIIVGATLLPEWLEPERAGVITSKENKIFISIVNKVLKSYRDGINVHSIKSDNIYHQSDLLNLAYRNMSVEEQIIKYTLNEDSYPLFYRNEEGKINGYLYDFLKLIQARTGLKFKYVKNTNENVWDELSLGNVDLVPVAYYDSEYNKGITLSNPYISITYRSIEKVDTINKSNNIGVLVSSNDSKLDYIRSVFSKSVISYSDSQSLLKDLELGIISQAYLPDDLIQGILARDFTDSFIVGKSKDKIIDISFAVSKKNKILSDVVNAVLETVDDEELKKLKRGYRQFNVIYGYEKSRVYKVVLSLIFVIILSCLVVYFWLNNLKLQVTLKDKDTKQLESKKEWLQNIINEQPSIIFIHGVNSKVSLSNCNFYQGEKCDNCILFSNEDEKYKNDNEKIITEGITINDTLLISNQCKLKFDQVDRIRKRIIDPKTNITYLLTVIHDITEQKKQEAELIKANKAAQNAVISRERFLASMSHELRTPIAGVMGLLELLSTRVKGTEKQGIVENISSSMHHLHLLVNDILDFSKLEAEQLSLELRDCHYLRELGNVFRLHNASALEKGINFRLFIQPTSIEVIKVDSLRLSQIVNNLLSNAVKFTEVGYVSVKVEVNDVSLKIAISDTGLGMNERQLKSVFKPFTQADNSIAREYGGTGLGLNIVNELIKLMKGELNIVSSENVGTEIECIIPIDVVSNYGASFSKLDITCKAKDEAIAQWIREWTKNDYSFPVDKKKVTIIDGNEEYDGNIVDSVIISLSGYSRDNNKNMLSINSTPLFIDELHTLLFSLIERENDATNTQSLSKLIGHVLIAEDNKINQILLVKQLSEFGVSADIANNGLEAFNKLKSNPDRYDLLITDCHMPILDGFALAKKVREEIIEFNDKPIIGCTAEDLRVSRLNGTHFGINHMLFKPYSIYELNSILISYLSGFEESCDCSFVDKFSELDDGGLINLFIETMSEDLTDLLTFSSEKEIKDTLHRIKGGMGSIGFDSIVTVINELSDMEFESNEYIIQKGKLISDMKIMINEASLWYKYKYE
ncbi:transporter substrate-binding domain-containing protein [Aliivibrio finisterrensis]|uniref:histidine kinase n=1 Tax=Aliivibrio finisterrensis TaxID=511998 RepID=A0A4Q5KW41_9GAMM|nr:transporter substrate-binding domain-containing protein [Aliivibrio finisterrensis]RYU51362.1 transporter substrate-binding domain-containing protein [Aliivibrio finisterrensis]RYU52542.1 transporter substrate-binding domain-containing protein [Aliivibrio finisterrensis]RYU58072.1 transporter substrate-binding domain-containing protein [Aliivibrio finisterrensis]RYU64560.1 transporter substrate-binding domain-containing protein [Aliivibrio finisterrensis]RYU88382.1 transporter substrate-bin